MSARLQADGWTSEAITSERNPLLRDVRKALTRGELLPDGSCAVESFHLLEEAIRSRLPVKVVLVAEGIATNVEEQIEAALATKAANVRVVVLPDRLFGELATTEATQGVIAVVEPPKWTLERVLLGRNHEEVPPLVVVLDALQDPGNAGNIVRTAEAFGASGAVFVKGSVSPFNPKTLRASAGSLFRLPFYMGVDAEALRAELQQRGLDVYAAMPRAEQALPSLDLTRGAAFIVGSEGRGVSAKLQSAAVGVRIPTRGVESLNAAMAAGVLLYEAARQRGLAGR